MPSYNNCLNLDRELLLWSYKHLHCWRKLGDAMIEIPLSKSTSLISPRLTVLINAVDGEGESNSSPYSWIFPLSASPPLIGMGIGGNRKLSYISSRRTGEFVVCIVSVNLVSKQSNVRNVIILEMNFGKNMVCTWKNQKKLVFRGLKKLGQF